MNVELSGFSVRLASRGGVIALKRLANRPKDRDALSVLEALRRRIHHQRPTWDAAQE